MHRQRDKTPTGIKEIKLKTAASKVKESPGIKNGTQSSYEPQAKKNKARMKL
jgi:hypothetical protein